MTAETKTRAFQALQARILSRSLELYEERTLLAELRRLRTKYRAGSAAVENPRAGDSHGDIAQALALAVWKLDEGGVGPGNRSSMEGRVLPGLNFGHPRGNRGGLYPGMPL